MSHISALKRCLSLLLAWGVLCGLMVFPSAQAAGRPPESGEWFYPLLSNANQEAYDAIYDQVERLAENSTDPSAVSFTPTQGSPDGAAIFAFFRDHPEYFWVDSSKLVWSESNGQYSLSSKITGESFFYEGFEVGSLSDVRRDFENKVDEIIAGMPTDGDTVAQLRYLNNWIAQHNVYNPLGVGASNYSRCAASGILSDNRETTGPVCYGYATAFKVLLDAADIPNAYIEGWAYNQNNWPYGEQHAWNYVKVNETWYAIDPTWDDPKLATAPARFHYFLVGSETVTETSSTMSSKGEFGQNHDASNSPIKNYKDLEYPTLSTSASGEVVTTGFELIQGGSSTRYDTLEKALQAAQSGGGTVKLWEPVTNLSQTLTIPDGVTLDLNGQNSNPSLSGMPVAISGSISGPLFAIGSGSEVSIITSGNFTSLENKGLSTCIQNDGTLTLGNNLALTPGVMGDTISGNEPELAPQSYRFINSKKVYNVYLVAQPESPQPGSYSAQSGDTVQNLIDRIASNGNGPSLSLYYYTSTGTTSPMVAPTVSWTVSRSPNDGNHTDPDDPLENGDYTFIAQVYDYAVPYTVTVSGVPDAPKQYTVTVNGGDGATGEGDYTEGEEVTVTAGTKAGYTFQKWTASGVALSNPNTSTVTFEMPDNDVTLTADFVQDPTPDPDPGPDPEPGQFTVTVNAGTGATGAGQYKEGDEVTVTAGTKAGYTFQKWTASGVALSNPDSATVTFDMPGNDVTLTADFVQDPTPDPEPGQFTLTVNAGTGATGAGQYKAGDKVTVTAGTKAGYAFQKWTASGVTLSNPTASTATFDMPDNDVTLTAQWSRISGGTSGGGSSASDDDDDDYTPPTTTEKHPDGSTTTTTTTGGTKTETTKYPDGSKKVVKTERDGTVTTTVTDQDGSQTQVVRNPDGSSRTTVDRADGSGSVTAVDADGRTAGQAVLSQAALEAAREKREPVVLPLPSVPVTTDRARAPSVTVDLPANGSARVEIPVEDVTPGTVAVLVKADGTEAVVKTSLATESGVAVILQSGATVKIVDNTKTFTDVPGGHWGAEAVAFASSRELFAGTSETTFSPGAAMTRAMFVTVLARFDGVDTSAGALWYEAGAAWAMAHGISDGAGLDQGLTREQLATMLWRYAGGPGADGGLTGYADAGAVSDWAVPAMAWAVERGILTGTTATTLSPQAEATRVQVAAILMRFIAQQ